MNLAFLGLLAGAEIAVCFGIRVLARAGAAVAALIIAAIAG